MRVDVNCEAEVGGQIAADFFPVVASVVRAHPIPMLLHEETSWPRRVHCDVVNAMADLRVRIGNVLRLQSTVDRLPAFTAVVCTKCTRSGDGNPNSLWIFRIKNNRMQAHAARARLPLGTGAVTPQSGEFLPVLAAISRFENRCVFDSSVNRIRIGERRLQMPHPLELPGMRFAVVELVCSHWRAGLSRRVIN